MVARAFFRCGASIVALSVAFLGTANAGALPGGGHFTSGKGAFDKSGSNLTVDQSSASGIIDWTRFSVGKSNSVDFDNHGGATLNRITGGNLSKIEGSLTSNGSVYVMNSVGVLVGKAGRVDTNGTFVATSGNIDDGAFGDRRLGITDANGRVVNRGVIISKAGDVMLAGNGAHNSGIISAKNGTAALAAGTSVLISPADSNGRISVIAGTGNARNSGAIDAASVELRAAGGNVYALAGNNGGIIRATGTGNIAGHIWLTSTDGQTVVDSRLKARSGNDAANGAGGRIETSGQSLSISHARIDAGRGGIWLLDPENLTVNSSAAKTIENSLNAGTAVKLETTKSSSSGPGTQSTGNGDIIVDSAIDWKTSAKFTLEAYQSIDVKKSIDASEKGALSLITNHGGTGGDLYFEGGSISFGKTSSALSINGNSYKLISTLAQLGSDTADNGNGYYAIAGNIDAKSLGTLSSSPVADSTEFGGVLEGLGHTISFLTIKDNSDADTGLVADNASGVVRDIHLTNVNITAHGSLDGANTGGLVGYNGGVVLGSSVSGKVSGAGGSATGGLVGINWGTLETSYSSATVSALVGEAYVGGLAGDDEGLVETAYATGNVSGGSGDIVGGLAGEVDNQNGIPVSMENVYATGDVTGSNSTIGGLGGLVGLVQSGKIEKAYATGTVKGENSYVGGVVGFADQANSFLDVYWDVSTSGISKSRGAGNDTNFAGLHGITTSQLKAVPSGFSASVWGESSSTNDGLPYLTALTSSY